MGTESRWYVLAVAAVLICFQFYMFPFSSTGTLPTGPNPNAAVNSIDTPVGTKNYRELEKSIFAPLGYSLRESLILPALDYTEPLNCPKVFSDWLIRSKSQNESGTPPKVIPRKMIEQYTLGGHAKLLMTYSDERSGINTKIWTKETIDVYVNGDEKNTTQYSGDAWGIYYAMLDYDIKGQKGLVVGSLSPYVEGYALKAGAKHVTTVEYTKIDVVGDDRVDYKNPIEIAEKAAEHIEAYDFIASFSSIEHSGLGRYGDALDPIGDLREAMRVYCMLKPNGLFFIGLPMGRDTVHFNLHRIYGRIRFAMFAAGFDVLGVYYQDKQRNVAVNLEMFSNPQHQFLVVLKKR